MVLRKLAIALLSVGVMLPGLSHALAVSDLKTKSALGEPFVGEIELSELGDLNADEIKASMASQEDFDRLGVERVYFLNDLKFDVVVNQGGRSYIRVTSPSPAREPYLDFVVRLAWPGNARLHGVTALLDLPVTSSTGGEEINQAVVSAPTEPTPTPVVQPEVAVSTPPEMAPAEAAAETPPAPVLTQPAPAKARPAKQPAAAAAKDGSYRTQAGDTMSKVAQKFRPDADSTAQTMVAIQRANPAAFANNNINQLKRDQVLQIPSDSQIREISAQEAIASVREQSGARAPAAPVAPAAKPAPEAQQVNATAKEAPVAPVAPAAPKAEVKLLGGQAGKAGSAAAGKVNGTAKAVDVKKIEENKARADAAKTEKDKLSGKVGKLGSEVKANDQKLAVQNAKLAELQTKLKEQEAAKQAAAAKAAEATKQAAAKAAEASKLAAIKAADAAKAAAATKAADAAKAAAAAKLAAAAPKAAPAVAMPAVPAATNAQTPDAHTAAAGAALAKELDAGDEKTLGADAKAQADQAAPAAPAVPAVVKKPVVVAVTEPEPETSSLPLIGGGVVGLLALLGGGFFWNRRRQQAEEAAALADLEASDADFDDADQFGYDEGDAEAGHGDELLFADESGDSDAAMHDRVLADPMEEVEQYLAFERYPQAVGFLNKAISANPDRADLRMKLLEVSAKLDDYHGFSEQEAWFEQQGDLSALAQIDEMKASLTPPAKTASRDDAIDFESSLIAHNADADSDITSLEDLEMDFNATVSASSPVLQAVSDDDLALPDLDQDFSFDEPAAVAVQDDAATAFSLDDELSDFDFDPSSSVKAAEPVQADDLSFDLDADAFDQPATADAALDDFAGFAEEKPQAVSGIEHDLSFEMDDAVTGDTSSSQGLGDVVDFDDEPQLKEPEVKTTDDDLSFSLDDLELDSGDGDFSLDTSSSSADLSVTDLSFDETVQMDSALNDAAADFDSTLKASAPAAAMAEPASADESGMDDEFDFLADTDENATKLDLARAYIDMGDMEGARDILQEVLNEGNSTQQDEAKGLLSQVG